METHVLRSLGGHIALLRAQIQLLVPEDHSALALPAQIEAGIHLFAGDLKAPGGPTGHIALGLGAGGFHGSRGLRRRGILPQQPAQGLAPLGILHAGHGRGLFGCFFSRLGGWGGLCALPCSALRAAQGGTARILRPLALTAKGAAAHLAQQILRLRLHAGDVPPGRGGLYRRGGRFRRRRGRLSLRRCIFRGALRADGGGGGRQGGKYVVVFC